MNWDEAHKIVLNKIDEWTKGSNKLVIGIDGIPGVGKTTLADYILNKRDSFLLIHIDDFMTPLEFRTEEVKKLDDPIDFFTNNWFEYEELKTIISKFKSGNNEKIKTLAYRHGKRDVPIEYDLSKSVLIIEGILLYHPDLLDQVWDKRIFLDGDKEKIKDRRVVREKERWGEKYIPEEDPISWFGFILKGLDLYQEKYKPHKKADLTLFIDPE